MDRYQSLQKLAALKEAGVLSEQEFHTQKRRILDEAFVQREGNEASGDSPQAKLLGSYAIGLFLFLVGVTGVSAGDRTSLILMLSLLIPGVSFSIAGLVEKEPHPVAYIAGLFLNLLSLIMLFVTY